MPVEVPIESVTQISFPGILGLKRAVSDNSQREKLLNQWADDYFQSIHSRFSLFSQGGGDWPKLSEATKAKRRQRLRSKTALRPYSETSILKDTLQLLNATRKKGGPGQIRRLDTNDFVLTVGIGAGVIYNDPVSPKRKTKKLLGTIAAYHAKRKRTIIVPPNAKTINKMETQAAIWILKRAKANRVP